MDVNLKDPWSLVIGSGVTIIIIIILFIFFTGSETFVYSFEDDMGGWEKAATDTDQPTVDWNIERTSNLSREGNYSVKLYLNNVNDKGKIWIQRPFDVKSENDYKVEVSYHFGSSDFGSFNLWKIITGVRNKEPTDADDLQYKGNTWNGESEESGYRWLKKSYEFSVTSGPKGEIWVFIGVWGTWETPRTYYIDDIKVTIK